MLDPLLFPNYNYSISIPSLHPSLILPYLAPADFSFMVLLSYFTSYRVKYKHIVFFILSRWVWSFFILYTILCCFLFFCLFFYFSHKSSLYSNNVNTIFLFLYICYFFLIFNVHILWGVPYSHFIYYY